MSGISTIQLTSRLRNIVPPSVQTSAESVPVRGSRNLMTRRSRVSGAGSTSRAELLARVGLAARVGAEAPRGQPAADVAAARDRRQVVELAEQAGARQALQHAEAEAAAADATAREAERRMARACAVAMQSHLGCGRGFWARGGCDRVRVQERVLVLERRVRPGSEGVSGVVTIRSRRGLSGRPRGPWWCAPR